MTYLGMPLKQSEEGLFPPSPWCHGVTQSWPFHRRKRLSTLRKAGFQKVEELLQWRGVSSAGVVILLVSLMLQSPKGVFGATFDYVPQPEFADRGSDLNVTSYLSQTSRIPCRVRHLGNKKVSWIRGKDLQVISSGRTKFISDIRVSILRGTNMAKKFDKRGIFLGERNHDNNAWNKNSDITKNKQFIWDKSARKRKLVRNVRTVNKANEYIYGWSLPDHAHHFNFEETNNDIGVKHHQTTNQRTMSLIMNKNKSRIHKTPDQDLPHKFSIDNYDDSQRTTAQFKRDKISAKDMFQISSHKQKNAYINKLANNMAYKRKNEILDPGGETSKHGEVDGNLKNPIFIRPLLASTELDNNLSPSPIHIPYNYLDEFWEPEDFTLQIRYTRENDAGKYLCQINTEPRMTQVIHLNVVEMIGQIEGPRELFVKEGSPVVITCRVTHGDELPGFIFWYKDDSLIDYDSTRRRIEVDMSRKGESQLILRRAVGKDSANYTCAPSGGKSDFITLTVIAEKRPEAVQQSLGFSLSGRGSNCVFIPTLVLIMMKALRSSEAI